LNEKTTEIEMQNPTLSNKIHIVTIHYRYNYNFSFNVQKFSSAVELWAWLIYNDAQRPVVSWWPD